MSRLIHLNGPPGIGKSTLARRYADEHPGVLNCDVDVLRTLVGGWRDDFARAGALIRPVALAMIEAHLAEGRDVVLPQLLVRAEELARFEGAAVHAGAAYVQRVLMDEAAAAVRRFHVRGTSGAVDPWHGQVRAIVGASGGDDLLARYHAQLGALVDERPEAVVIASVEGDEDATYRALLASLA